MVLELASASTNAPVGPQRLPPARNPIGVSLRLHKAMVARANSPSNGLFVTVSASTATHQRNSPCTACTTGARSSLASHQSVTSRYRTPSHTHPTQCPGPRNASMSQAQAAWRHQPAAHQYPPTSPLTCLHSTAHACRMSPAQPVRRLELRVAVPALLNVPNLVPRVHKPQRLRQPQHQPAGAAAPV